MSAAKLLLAPALLFLACNVEAQEEWTGAQIALGTVALGLRLIDYGQTMDIVRRQDDTTYYETNRLIGRQPDRGDVNTYFLISTLAMAAAAHYIPSWRTALLSGYAVIGVYYATKNYQIGLRVNF